MDEEAAWNIVIGKAEGFADSAFEKIALVGIAISLGDGDTDLCLGLAVGLDFDDNVLTLEP